MRVLIVGGGRGGGRGARPRPRRVRDDADRTGPPRGQALRGRYFLAAFGEFGIPSSVIERSVRTLTLVSPGARGRTSRWTIPPRHGPPPGLRFGAERNGASGGRKDPGWKRRSGLGRSFAGRPRRDGRGPDDGDRRGHPSRGGWGEFGRGKVARPSGRAHLLRDPGMGGVFAGSRRPLVRAVRVPFPGGRVARLLRLGLPKKEALTVGTGTALSRARSLPKYLSALKRSIGLDLADRPVLRREVFPIPIGRIGPIGMTRPSLFAGSVLFLGDAAGLVMPTSGEGIYYAMKSGEIAARAVRENSALPGRVGRAYAAEWKRAFDRRYAVMGRLQAFFYRDDDRREKLVAIQRLKGIQEISRSLWLDHDLSARTLLSYSRRLFTALKEVGSQGRGGESVR